MREPIAPFPPATAAPDTLAGFRAALSALPAADEAARATARAREARLTKPQGALGRLEDLARWYAGWQPGRPGAPRAARVVVFAGNHGVADRGVSAFPSAVTAQMVANFRAGGAAINQLARVAGAGLAVVPLAGLAATADFTARPALEEDALLTALRAGWEAVPEGCDLFIPAEMGIANTTAAAALCAALFGGGAEPWTGRGTGVDDAGLARKAEAIDAGLARHGAALHDPWEALRRLGGHEIAAMTGAILGARMARVPVLLDGFVASAAAAVLAVSVPGALDHAQAGHLSAEAAHGLLLAHLGLVPILDLGMRLGEGSGAAVALGVLRAALAAHAGMATFEEAGVSGC
ncbi:MAG: nicotinate-nucleotide--dimethylbenzimidazole phosphoribosyltransferase [Rhodobacteraceae bacterium]|nr:nicotinate-nucleotide--dimethylbenzimidazole phosphoribosyltransferase [Paracoccaceae bacterium]